MTIVWTEEKIEFLRENYATLSNIAIAEQLGLTANQVKNKASREKLIKRRPITDHDRETIRRLYPTTPTKEICELLGRSKETVYNVAHNMGLSKDPEYLRLAQQEWAKTLAESGKGHRFKKGQTPPNKGLRRPGWHRGRMKETQFKKGVRQGVAVQLYKPIGSERLSKEGYLERKVNDDLPLQGRWKQVHRIVWEEANGTVPKGHIVGFKDGDKTNIALENLELLSRKDLMARNTIHTLPDDVRGAIHVMAGFRRKLNRYAKKQD